MFRTNQDPKTRFSWKPIFQTGALWNLDLLIVVVLSTWYMTQLSLRLWKPSTQWSLTNQLVRLWRVCYHSDYKLRYKNNIKCHWSKFLGAGQVTKKNQHCFIHLSLALNHKCMCYSFSKSNNWLIGFRKTNSWLISFRKSIYIAAPSPQTPSTHRKITSSFIKAL